MLFQIPFCVCKMLLIKAGLERFFFENNNRYLFSSQSSGRISIILVGKEKPREIECSDSVMLIKETSYLSFSNSKYWILFIKNSVMVENVDGKKNIQNICYFMYNVHVHPYKNFMPHSKQILPSIILLKILVKQIGGYSASNNGVTCIK